MQTKRFQNELPGVTGEMTVRYDLTTGMTRAYGTGFWSPRQASDYFAYWRRIVALMHAGGVSLSALVEMGDGQVQSAEVTQIIASVTSEIYRPGDAIAMLMPSNLSKMQARRILDGRFHEFFVSRAAAETWLTARASYDRLRAG